MQKLKACFYSTGCKSPRPLLISPNKTLRRCRAYNRQFTALHTFSKYGKCRRIIHVVLLLPAVVLAWGQASWGTKSQDAHLASPTDFFCVFIPFLAIFPTLSQATVCCALQDNSPSLSHLSHPPVTHAPQRLGTSMF